MPVFPVGRVSCQLYRAGSDIYPRALDQGWDWVCSTFGNSVLINSGGFRFEAPPEQPTTTTVRWGWQCRHWLRTLMHA